VQSIVNGANVVAVGESHLAAARAPEEIPIAAARTTLSSHAALSDTRIDAQLAPLPLGADGVHAVAMFAVEWVLLTFTASRTKKVIDSHIEIVQVFFKDFFILVGIFFIKLFEIKRPVKHFFIRAKLGNVPTASGLH